MFSKVQILFCAVGLLVNDVFGSASNIESTSSPPTIYDLLQNCPRNPNYSYHCSHFTTTSTTPKPKWECKAAPPKPPKLTVLSQPLDSLLIHGVTLMNTQRDESPMSGTKDSAVFILGNTGSGKTTVTQILIGDLTRLHATKTGKGSLFIFDDDNRIGAPSTVSKTLFPEYIVHPGGHVAFWDCPGFDDTRGSDLDIAAMYFLKHALDTTKHAKFLFLLLHSSVKAGHDRSDITKLVTHATRLIKNIPRMRDSIGLLLTKVGSYSTETGGYLTDDVIMAQIVEFLQNTYLANLRANLNSDKTTAEEKVEIQSKIDFITGVLALDEVGQEPRIFFQRSPQDCGPLKEMSSILDSRTKITQMYNKTLKYSVVTPNDFRFTLKDSTYTDVSNNFMPAVVTQIQNSFIKAVTNIRTQLDKHFYANLPTDIDTALGLLNATESILQNYQIFYENSNQNGESLYQLHTNLSFPINATIISELRQYEKQLEFYKNMTNNQLQINLFPPTKLPDWRELEKRIGVLQDFYEFCKETNTDLDEKQSVLVRVSKILNMTKYIEDGNVLNFLIIGKLKNVPSKVSSVWETIPRNDKKYLEDLVQRSLDGIECAHYIPSEDTRKVEIPPLKAMLSEGIAKINKQNLTHKTSQYQPLFILGSKNSGKSILTQMLFGDLARLHALYKENGEMIIVKSNKQGTRFAQISESIVPHLFFQSGSEMLIWDCPGFDVTRSMEMDIAAVSFLEYLLHSARSAKFLFTVEASSMKSGDDINGFDQLVASATKLLKNAKRLRNSIGLVVVNVDNYEPHSGKYLSDSEIITQITRFFQHTYIPKIRMKILATQNHTEKATNQSKIEFVESLMERNRVKIVFVRNPTRCGPLETKMFQNTKRQITQLFKETLTYSPITQQDFQITLKPETIAQVDKQIEEIKSKIGKIILEIVTHAKTQFQSIFYKEETLISEESFQLLNKIAKNFAELITNANTSTLSGPTFVEEFTSKMEFVYGDLRLLQNHKNIFCLKKLEQEIQLFEKTKSQTGNFTWLEPVGLAHIQKFSLELSNMQKFYNFCSKAEVRFAEYEIQNKFYDLGGRVANVDENSVLTFIHENNLVSVDIEIMMIWDKLNAKDKKFLYKLFRRNVPTLKIWCDINTSSLYVAGNYLMLSRVLRALMSSGDCGWFRFNIVNFMASERLFIDESIDAKGRQMQIYVIAPIWQVIAADDDKNRVILLAGSQPSSFAKAESGSSFGESGRDGLTGRPAQNGGSLYGVYGRIENGKKLKIYADGGNGGNGQDGGDGHVGASGNDASLNQIHIVVGISFTPPPDSERGYFQNGNLLEDRPSQGFWDFGGCYGDWYSKRGEKGQSGGNGGNGGHGGSPGLAGNITLIGVATKFGNQGGNHVFTSSLYGNVGTPGSGGVGAKGGNDGRHMSCCYSPSPTSLGHFKSKCKRSDSLTEGYSGLDGERGGTTTRPGYYPKYPEYWQILSEFRAAFFETQHSPQFTDFTYGWDTSNSLISKSEIGFYAEELLKVEKTFYPIGKLPENERQAKYIAYYHQFLRRLSTFRNYSSGNDSDLAYFVVYSSAATKLVGMKASHGTVNIIKTKDYFDQLIGQMRSIKEAKRESVIESERSNYKTKLDTKITEVENLIETTVKSAIKEAFNAMDGVSSKFFAEIGEFVNATRVDLERRKKAKRDFESAMQTRAFFGVVRTIGAACQFLGPVGMVAGGLITTGASAAQSFMHSPPSQGPRGSLALPIPIVNMLGDESKEYFRNKIAKTEKLIKIVKQADQLAGGNLLGDVTRIADTAQVSIEALKRTSSDVRDPVKELVLEREVDASVEKMRDATNKHLKRLEEARKGEERTIKIIKNLANTLNTADALKDLILDAIDTSSEAERLGYLIQEAEVNLKGFKLMSDNFYEDILPPLQAMSDKIKNKTSKIQGSSAAALSVGKWELKKVLKLMRTYIKEITRGFKVAEQFITVLDTLDEALLLLIDLYSHIERYQEKKDLADFISNNNAANWNLEEISDFKLRGVLKKLEFFTKANLFLEEYQKGVGAFKQWSFPYANKYFGSAKTTNPRAPTSLEELLTIYERELAHLSSQLAKYQATTERHDQWLHVSSFRSGLNSGEPFFVWRNGKFKDSIKRLLAGEPVLFKADVEMLGVFFEGKSAIKYSNIELVIKACNSSRQTDLEEKLNHFQMKMTHSGKSLYKVMGTQYVFFDQNITYSYTFERTENNNHVTMNGAKYKVSTPSVDFMMSPYTWWTFQLVDVKVGGIGFADLREFEDTVDLSLEGIGVYFDEKGAPQDFRESLKLNEYYEAYEN